MYISDVSVREALEATSLTAASNQTRADTSRYSKHGYVNTKESPKEESKFSCRHLQLRLFTLGSELTEPKQAALSPMILAYFVSGLVAVRSMKECFFSLSLNFC